MHDTMKLVIAISLAVILAACARQPPDRYQQAYDAIDQVVSKAMYEAGTPGLALAITSRDHLLYEGYYGFADLRHQTPPAGTTCSTRATTGSPICDTRPR
jgi:CubicO group peptidase (beta-lactamase class C family)